MKNREKRKDGIHMGFGVGFQLMNAVFPLLFLIVFVFVISNCGNICVQGKAGAEK